MTEGTHTNDDAIMGPADAVTNDEEQEVIVTIADRIDCDTSAAPVQEQRHCQTVAEERPLDTTKQKNLRCLDCGRHIVSVITNHAIVSGTCQRRNCKKVNIFHIQGDRVITDIETKSEIIR